MINKSSFLRIISLHAAVAAFVLISGHLTDAAGQNRDPFAKPAWARTKENRPGGVGTPGTPGSTPAVYGVPPIQQRIDYYKRLRENAAANGQPIPKVTSVLSLNEMAVTGIFHTPRGYAAMVEAVPIRLSYTIYPGEKFFDGQLVAVEENRLVFRKVTKVGKDKFVSSVENKALRQYSEREQIQGTAPMQTEASNAAQPAQQVASGSTPAAPTQIVSPLDEMNQQVPGPDPASKPSKKPVKTAKNDK
jgi:hypothetical protein